MNFNQQTFSLMNTIEARCTDSFSVTQETRKNDCNIITSHYILTLLRFSMTLLM